MSIYEWPSTNAFRWAGQATLHVIDNTQRIFESPTSGDTRTKSMPGARWAWEFSLPAENHDDRRAIEGYMVRLSGRIHRVRLWDQMRPTPLGTINMSGVTLASSSAQFSQSLVLAGCGNSKTLLAGDWLSVGGQLFMSAEDAQSNAGGQMAVEVRQMTRAIIASSSAVQLIKPTALYIRTEGTLSLPRVAQHTQLDANLSFVEVFE